MTTVEYFTWCTEQTAKCLMNHESASLVLSLLSSLKILMTCTSQKLQSKLKEKHDINTSSGTLLNHKPFYTTLETEKEKISSMCKLCLNTRLKFDALNCILKK